MCDRNADVEDLDNAVVLIVVGAISLGLPDIDSPVLARRLYRDAGLSWLTWRDVLVPSGERWIGSNLLMDASTNLRLPRVAAPGLD